MFTIAYGIFAGTAIDATAEAILKNEAGYAVFCALQIVFWIGLAWFWSEPTNLKENE